jgi:hypothetical protein
MAAAACKPAGRQYHGLAQQAMHIAPIGQLRQHGVGNPLQINFGPVF